MSAGDDRQVTILAAELVRPYDAPRLSKEALGPGAHDVSFRRAEWYVEHGIGLRLVLVTVAIGAGLAVPGRCDVLDRGCGVRRGGRDAREFRAARALV